MRFGISTHLYHAQRLSREHLAEVAAHGFDTIELFATRSHFDYHDKAAIARLQSWLVETKLTLHSIHAPVTTGFADGEWGPAFTNAAQDEETRKLALEETAMSLEVARRIPTNFLVVHVGLPNSQTRRPSDNTRAAAIRSFEHIHRMASELSVRVAVELIPNDLSTPASLVRLLEDETDLAGAGVCLDIGHAMMLGDAVDAIEVLSGHIVTTHVHDNDGRHDDHLAPFDGIIDWTAALMAFQKVGYEGTFLLELGNTGSTAAVLERACAARGRFERIVAARTIGLETNE